MTDDPRIEAAALAFCGPDHKPDPDAARPCWSCVADARLLLAAADAVDPLRDDDALHALVARGIADRYSLEPPDAEDHAEAKLVVAAIRKGLADDS